MTEVAGPWDMQIFVEFLGLPVKVLKTNNMIMGLLMKLIRLEVRRWYPGPGLLKWDTKKNERESPQCLHLA